MKRFLPLARHGLLLLALCCASCGQPEGGATQETRPLRSQSSYYRAGTQDWQAFLTCWARQMDHTWHAPKTDALKEEHLSFEGQAFPKSYVDFLRATGSAGFVLPGDLKFLGESWAGRLLPIHEVGLLKDHAPVTWQAWQKRPARIQPNDEQYYNYTAAQQPEHFKESYVEFLVLIADLGDGVVLALNPQEKTQDGEWEAWLFAAKPPGAERYRSFAELMQEVYWSDVDPESPGLSSAKELKNTCAEKIYPHFREYPVRRSR